MLIYIKSVIKYLMVLLVAFPLITYGDANSNEKYQYILAVKKQNPEIKITGFKQGLMTFDQNKNARIYSIGQSFTYKNNGICLVQGNRFPCVWHGFEFSYTSNEADITLECTSESNIIRDQVTPSQLIDGKTKIAHWSFTLHGKSGHYQRPQYTVLSKSGKFIDASRCTFNGQEVFKFDFILDIPKEKPVTGLCSEEMSHCKNSEYGCISLGDPKQTATCDDKCLLSVIEKLHAAGVPVKNGAFDAPSSPVGCVGARLDLGGTEKGAQCIARVLGYEYKKTGCNIDGWPYNIRLK